MSKYELKTKVNDQSVIDFLEQNENLTRRTDSFVLLEIFKEITKEEPKMWGESIVGFGKYSYIAKSGMKGEYLQMGFFPRKQNLTLYLMCGFEEYDKTDKMKDFLEKLGKYKISKACLYINKLADIDQKILKQLLEFAWENRPV
jgi:hypothetical protein